MPLDQGEDRMRLDQAVGHEARRSRDPCQVEEAVAGDVAAQPRAAVDPPPGLASP